MALHVCGNCVGKVSERGYRACDRHEIYVTTVNICLINHLRTLIIIKGNVDSIAITRTSALAAPQFISNECHDVRSIRINFHMFGGGMGDFHVFWWWPLQVTVNGTCSEEVERLRSMRSQSTIVLLPIKIAELL